MQTYSVNPVKASIHMTTVVAALITRDSKLLVCQRHRDDTNPLQWEFPGGKVEPGETPMQALEREILEELGVYAIIGRELFRTTHQYPQTQKKLALIFFQAEIEPSAQLQNMVFEQIEWADVSTLPQYDFLEADKELIAQLVSGEIRLAWSY